MTDTTTKLSGVPLTLNGLQVCWPIENGAVGEWSTVSFVCDTDGNFVNVSYTAIEPADLALFLPLHPTRWGMLHRGRCMDSSVYAFAKIYFDPTANAVATAGHIFTPHDPIRNVGV